MSGPLKDCPQCGMTRIVRTLKMCSACEVDERASAETEKWRQFATRLAEALVYAHRWMEQEGHDCEGRCEAATALADYAAATKERP